MTTIRAFLPKIRALFPIFEKGQGRPPSKSPANFVCSYFATLDFVCRQPMSCAVMDQNLILPVTII